jgi:hypothetical protein
MNTPTLRAMCCAATMALPAMPAAATVTVQFVQPEHFADAGDYGVRAQRNLESIKRHLQTMGDRCLPAGHVLDIRIIDLDLAGRHEWWRPGAYDARIMRDITWPRADLQYLWKDAQGSVLADKRERVSDINYLARSAFVRSDSDPLIYDKAMFSEWFERRFCPQQRG